MNPDELRELRLVDLVAALAPQQAVNDATERYVDLKSSGLYRPALAAIRRGELRAYKPAGSRKLLVTVDDWRAWIERSEHRVPADSEPTPEASDDVDAIIDANRRRRASKRAT